MIKDYVKSEKGTDFPSFFDDTIEQSEFDFYMNKFYEYRANLFTGGICVKEYVSLKEYAGKKNEVRGFYGNGKLLCTTRNESPCALMKNPPESLICKYEHLQNPFYTIDFAETDDGSWKIIEAGDGQVSGLLETIDYQEFFRLLALVE